MVTNKYPILLAAGLVVGVEIFYQIILTAKDADVVVRPAAGFLPGQAPAPPPARNAAGHNYALQDSSITDDRTIAYTESRVYDYHVPAEPAAGEEEGTAFVPVASVKRGEEPGELGVEPSGGAVLDTTIQDGERLLKERPDDIALHQSLANLLLESGETVKAMEILSYGAMANPTNPEFHALYADYLKMFERYDEAANEYRTALAFDAENAEVKYNLGETYAAMGNDYLAQEYKEEARRLWTLETGEVDKFLN